MGDGSPGSREAEGEGGEGFYIAQSGSRCPDLLVIGGEVWDLSRPVVTGTIKRIFLAGKFEKS